MGLFSNNLHRGLLFAWKPLLALAVKHDPSVTMAIQADTVIDTDDTSLHGHQIAGPIGDTSHVECLPQVQLAREVAQISLAIQGCSRQ